MSPSISCSDQRGEERNTIPILQLCAKSFTKGFPLEFMSFRLLLLKGISMAFSLGELGRNSPE